MDALTKIELRAVRNGFVVTTVEATLGATEYVFTDIEQMASFINKIFDLLQKT